MKRLLMLALAIGGISCAVDSAPSPPPVSVDDSALTSTGDPEAFPDCISDPCETLAQCARDGGLPGERCNLTGFCCYY
jgi:hypothetical protein